MVPAVVTAGAGVHVEHVAEFGIAHHLGDVGVAAEE